MDFLSTEPNEPAVESHESRIPNSLNSDSPIAKALKAYFNDEYSYALEQFSMLQRSQSPDEVNIAFFIGNCHFQLKNYENAEAFWLEALNITPDSSKILINLGNLYHLKGQTNKAILYWLKARRLLPESDILNYNLAVAYSGKNYREQAFSHYEKYLKYGEESKDESYEKVTSLVNEFKTIANAHITQANALLSMQKITDAIQCYTKSLSVYPLQPEVHVLLSKLYYKIKNYSKSLQHSILAYRTDPHGRYGLTNAAVCFNKTGMYNYSFCFFTRAAKQNDQNILVLKHLKQASLLIDKNEEAINMHLEKAKKYEEDCRFQKALEEYENFLYLTRTTDETVISSIQNLRAYLNPEKAILPILMQELEFELIQEHFDKIVNVCQRLIKIAPERSRESMYAKRKKFEANARMIGENVDEVIKHM